MFFTPAFPSTYILPYAFPAGAAGGGPLASALPNCFCACEVPNITCCGPISGWQELLEADRWRAPSPQDIVSSYRGNDMKLSVDDIILQVRCTAVLMYC